jgi:hypothetical protein
MGNDRIERALKAMKAILEFMIANDHPPSFRRSLVITKTVWQAEVLGKDREFVHLGDFETKHEAVIAIMYHWGRAVALVNETQVGFLGSLPGDLVAGLVKEKVPVRAPDIEGDKKG